MSKIAYHFGIRRAVLISGQNRKKMKEKETKKTEACKNDTAEQKRADMQLHGSERRPQASKMTITRQQSSKSKKTP